MMAIVMVIGFGPATAVTVFAEEQTVNVNLMPKAVDEDGDEISGKLDAKLYAGETDLGWFGNNDYNYYTEWSLNVGENTITGWDICPKATKYPTMTLPSPQTPKAISR